MSPSIPSRIRQDRTSIVCELAAGGRMLRLADLLGLKAELIASVLVDVVERDPALRTAPGLTHLAPGGG